MRRVFDFKLDGIKVEGNNSYPKKALLWICPPGTTFTKEDCKYLMDEYFNLCKDVGTILEAIVPSFDSSTGYHEADHWGKHLDLDDLHQVFNLSYLKPSFGDLATFFKSSRNYLYSYIKHGVALKEFFQTFDINDAKYLLPEDISSIQTFPPQMANEAVDNTANDACDAVVTPTSTPVRTIQASIDVVSYEVKDTVRALDTTGNLPRSIFLYTVYLTPMLLPVPPSSNCHRKNVSMLTKPIESQRNTSSKVSLCILSPLLVF